MVDNICFSCQILINILTYKEGSNTIDPDASLVLFFLIEIKLCKCTIAINSVNHSFSVK